MLARNQQVGCHFYGGLDPLLWSTGGGHSLLYQTVYLLLAMTACQVVSIIPLIHSIHDK